MAHKFYIVPAAFDTPPLGSRAPKYFEGGDTNVTSPWTAFDYGSMPTFLVASDTSVLEDVYLRAQLDVFAFDTDSDNLSDEIGGPQVPGLRSALEALNIPGNWVSGSDTYREVLRATMGVFQFAQRMNGTEKRDVLPEGTNLSVQWRNLPQDHQDAMVRALNSFGYTVRWADNTPFRSVLKDLADQWGVKPFHIGVTV